MKKFISKTVICGFCFGLMSCGPSLKDCDVLSGFEEGLVVVTPIQPIFRQGDTLTISCNIPAQNGYFLRNRNIFDEIGDAQATWTFVNGREIIRNQQLIVRKGFLDGPFFIAVYDAACDCYEFEADLVLSEVGSYNTSTVNTFDFLNNCDGFSLETTFPWVNQPNLLEFEVVP